MMWRLGEKLWEAAVMEEASALLGPIGVAGRSTRATLLLPRGLPYFFCERTESHWSGDCLGGGGTYTTKVGA